MDPKPTYEALEQEVNELKDEILAQKRTEASLAKRNAELERQVDGHTAKLLKTKTFLDNVLRYSGGDAIMATDMNMRIQLYNRRAMEVFGYDEAAVLGKSVWEMHLKENVDRDRFERAIRAVREKGLFEYDVRVKLPEGGNRWFHSVVTPLRNEKGTQLGYVLNSRDVTEHRLIEKEIQKLSVAVEQSPSAIAITDLGGRLEYVNRKFTELTGYTREAAMGQNPRILKSGEQPDEMYKELWDTITSGNVWRGEFHNKRRNGDLFWEAASVSPILDNRGRIINYIKVAEDITEQKRTREDLLNQKYFLQKAQEIGGIGTWDLNIKENVLLWTDETYRIFGLPMGTKLTYETFLNCVHPEDREYVDRKWKAAFEKASHEKAPYEKAPYDIEHRLLVDGKVKWVREQAELQFNDRGECIRGTGVTQDITLHKHLLEQAKQKLIALTQPEIDMGDLSLNDILGKDMLQRLQDAFAEAFGMTSIIYGLDGSPFTTPSCFTSFCELVRSTEKGAIDCEAFDGELMRTLRKAKTPQIRRGCVLKNMVTGTVPIVIQGHHFANWGIGQLVDGNLDLDEVKRYALEIGLDHEALMAAAKELKPVDNHTFERIINFVKTLSDQISLLALQNLQQGRTLSERMAAEKARKELEGQLQRARKMEAIGTLAGGVAHDLNNILSGLVSYPELLLLQLPDKSPLRKPIRTIQKSGEKAAAVVQDLLTLARRGVVVTEAVHLNDVVKEYLNSPEYERLLSYHPDVRITTHLEQDALAISGSPTHLSNTVMNLVSNAVEAMPRGGEVVISTENRYIDRPIRGYDHVKEGDYAMLTIEDAGMGISPDDMEKIFEPFYTKKKMGRSGTGLGMAVVWGTVKDHKGYINLESTEGEGTTFTLYFPVIREALSDDPSALPVDALMGNGESILIVDDMAEQREIASGILKALGYSVTTVSSGEEAVRYLKTGHADLLVLDMIMDPGMDGLDTYKRILEIRPGQKAVIASGFSESARIRAVQRLGAGAYVKKPFLLEKIGMAVKKELEKEKGTEGTSIRN